MRSLFGVLFYFFRSFLFSWVTSLLAAMVFVGLLLSGAYAETPVLPSCNKPLPEGYSQAVQPNVLLLLDTSGSMMQMINSETSTFGDGSKPLFYGNKVYRYFGCDLDSSNNNPNVALNYHPNLIYIDSSDLSGMLNYSSYFATHNKKYLYPNDSRMYKLKLVLWEILNDPGLVTGLRLGLATYYQQKNSPPKVPAVGVYYQWPPVNGGVAQALSWEGGTSWNMALLRRFFRSTDEPGSLEEITKWIDGIETSDNPELRAHGSTPLAASIYGAGSHRTGSEPYYGDAKDFFTMTDPSDSSKNAINAWCQQNWLIVLTDGADTQTAPYNTSPVNAVKNLYNTKIYVKVPGTNTTKLAQPIRTMVIGLINPNANDVATLKNTLNRMADVGDDGIENSSSSAYFASDVNELLQAFKDIFQQIQSFKSTAEAPLVSPPRGGQDGGTYVPGFVPRIDRQWTGHLYKYTIDVDGNMSSSPQWDAGSKLDAVSFGARRVFTVSWSGGNWKTDFKENNVSTLAPMLGLATNQASKFIRWALGSDEWDEVLASERYKLGDIYHSGLVEVGPPNGNTPHVDYLQFKTDNANRKKLVYVQANDGMLHAFDANTGEESWAFVPPNVLAEGRMAGLKQDLTKTGNDIAANWIEGARSNARYLLDGPITAEDVLLGDGKYHTVLLGLLGYAGPGLYALDITDPGNPVFMWAVENVIYKRTGNELVSDSSTERYVSYWVRSGNKATRSNTLHKNITDSDDLDYKDLRFAVSTPAVGYVLVPKGIQGVGPQWIAVMGNGSQMGINGDISSASVYVINIENGKLLKVFKQGGSVRQIITPVAILWTGSTRLIKYFYVGSDRGIIYEGDLNGSDSKAWTMRGVFDTKSLTGLSYIIDVAYIDRNKWLFVITGDYEGLLGSDNADNRNYMISANISAGASSADDLPKLNTSAGSVSNDSKGWCMEMSSDEYATTPPVYYSGYVFFSTYIKSEDPCSVGKSRIYVLNARTGKGAWNGNAKYVELGGIKVSGIVVSEGRVYAGITKYPQADTSLPSDLKVGNEAARIQEGLLVFDVPPEVANQESNYPSGVMKPSYWRRWIP